MNQSRVDPQLHVFVAPETRTIGASQLLYPAGSSPSVVFKSSLNRSKTFERVIVCPCWSFFLSAAETLFWALCWGCGRFPTCLHTRFACVFFLPRWHGVRILFWQILRPIILGTHIFFMTQLLTGVAEGRKTMISDGLPEAFVERGLTWLFGIENNEISSFIPHRPQCTAIYIKPPRPFFPFTAFIGSQALLIS